MEELMDQVKGLEGKNSKDIKREIDDKLENMDEDKKERLLKAIKQAQDLNNNTTKEEKEKIINEVKNNLSLEQQIKLQKAAKIFKGFMKNKNI